MRAYLWRAITKNTRAIGKQMITGFKNINDFKTDMMHAAIRILLQKPANPRSQKRGSSKSKLRANALSKMRF